jgi:hypothetical protein
MTAYCHKMSPLTSVKMNVNSGTNWFSNDNEQL